MHRGKRRLSSSEFKYQKLCNEINRKLRTEFLSLVTK